MTTKRGMSQAERRELGRLVERTRSIAKQETKAREAELLADFEVQLAAVYDPIDLNLEGAIAEANRKLAALENEINGIVAAACEERGIPSRFRPSVGYPRIWSSRGENATAKRRTELRKVAERAARAARQQADAEIERRSFELEKQLALGQLESEEARRFVAELPTPQSLMPPLSVKDVARLGAAQGARTPEETARLMARVQAQAALPVGHADDDG